MPVPAPPQPFYTSKSFWTATLALLVLLYHAWETKHFDIDQFAAVVFLLLTNVFRWSADQPLALPGPGVRKTRSPMDSTRRLTKD